MKGKYELPSILNVRKLGFPSCWIQDLKMLLKKVSFVNEKPLKAIREHGRDLMEVISQEKRTFT